MPATALAMNYCQGVAVMHEVRDCAGELPAVIAMIGGHPDNSKDEPHLHP